MKRHVHQSKGWKLSLAICQIASNISMQCHYTLCFCCYVSGYGAHSSVTSLAKHGFESPQPQWKTTQGKYLNVYSEVPLKRPLWRPTWSL